MWSNYIILVWPLPDGISWNCFLQGQHIAPSLMCLSYKPISSSLVCSNGILKLKQEISIENEHNRKNNNIMMYVYISIYHNYLDWKSKESSCNFFRFPQVFCHLLLFWSSRVFAFHCLLTNLLYFSCPWWRERNKYSFVQINTSKESQLSK